MCGRQAQSHHDQAGCCDLGDPVGTRGFCAGTSPGQDRVTQNSVGPHTISPRLANASTRANFLLRALPPDATRDFARRHDCSLRSCLSTLLKAEIPEVTWDIASLPLSLGGLGLVSAQRIRHAARWASWGDSLEMVRQRHPGVAAVMIRELQGFGLGLHFEAVVRARQVLVDAGFAPPSWDDLARGLRPAPLLDDDDPNTSKHGWQYLASQPVNAHFLGATVWPRSPDASWALLRSQSGPLSSAPFTCCPTARHTTLDV